MCFFFSSRRRHTRCYRDWSSDVCSSDLAGDEAELNLGKCENGFRMISRNSVGTGKRELDGAAQTRTVDRTDERRSHSLYGIQEQLSFMTHPIGFGGGFEVEKFIDIRAGDPAVGLAAQQNSGSNVQIALEPVEQLD